MIRVGAVVATDDNRAGLALDVAVDHALVPLPGVLTS